MQQEFKTTRINESLFSGIEQRMLAALVVRTPMKVKPDHLTGLGVVGAAVVFAGYCLSNLDVKWLWLANVGIAIHWVGDSLDGTLARHRSIERPRYGFYLDQVIDTIGNLLMAAGLGLSPWVHFGSAMMVLALYHMLSVQTYVRTIVDREFHVAPGRLGPTEMRVGMIAMNICILVFGMQTVTTWPVPLEWGDLFLGVVVIGLFWLFLAQKIRHLNRLKIEEPALR